MKRFALVYFVIYAIASPALVYIVPLPTTSIAPRSMNRIVTWIGAHVFGLASMDVTSGSIDRAFDWVQLAWIVTLSAVLTLAWFALDRRGRRNTPPVDAWLHLVLRVILGAVFFGYGVIKLLPVQFREPSLAALIQPLGTIPPPTLLFHTIGASPAYEAVIGCIETVAGLLLLLPRTARAGAFLALGPALYILLLNLSYDITDKIFTIHLALIAVLLAWPDLTRVYGLVVRRTPQTPSPVPPPLFARGAAARAAVIVQLLAAAYIVTLDTWQAADEWRAMRAEAARPSSMLHGIWNIDGETVDGQSAPPLGPDAAAWRRIVFEDARAVIQRMDDSLLDFDTRVDAAGGAVSLTPRSPAAEPVAFGVERPDADHLVLDANINDRAVRLRLSRLDPASFPLRAHRFRWVQDRRAAGQ